MVDKLNIFAISHEKHFWFYKTVGFKICYTHVLPYPVISFVVEIFSSKDFKQKNAESCNSYKMDMILQNTDVLNML